MQSSGLVLWLVALACACDPSLASTGGTPRPRNTLLALVRAATALHHHPPAAHPPQIPALPANALLEYPHLYRRHHAAPDGPPGPLLPAAHRHYDEAEEQPEGDAEEQQEEQQERRAWGKRGGQQQEEESDAPVSGGAGEGQQEGQQEAQQEAAVAAGLQQVGASIATNFLRHARSGPRPYDVPRIDCPAAEDQMERFPCPSPDRMGRYRCIDDHVLCDGFIDCPDGEDEDRQQCMFYKTTKAHLDVLADAIIRWARGGK